MLPVALVMVYAVLMSFWWILTRLLMNMGKGKVPFSNNIIRLASGFGAGTLIVLSLSRNGGISYLQSMPKEFWGPLVIDVLLNIGIAYCFIKAMQRSVASIAVHVPLLGPVVAIGTSYVFGVDKLPSALGGTGILLVLSGLFVLHFNPKKYGINLAGPVRDIWQERGNWLIYALGIAILAGFAIPIDKRLVLLSDNALAPGLVQFFSWGVFYAVLASRNGDFKTLSVYPRRRMVIGLLALGLTFGVAQAFQAQAYHYQHAAVVASLKRLDAPITVLWAFLIFRNEEQAEGSFVFRILGSLVAVSGVLLIGLD